MSRWTEIRWDKLGADHLDKPLLVIYPDTYAKDYTLGTLQSVHVVKGVKVQVTLRGGGGVEILLGDDAEQERLFVRRSL